MSLVRTMSLGLRVLVGTTWAACLVVLGLLLADGGFPRLLNVPRAVWALVGLASVGAGLFIFMTIVADRLVPSVGRRLSMWRLEMAMMMLALLCGGAAVLVLVYRGTSG
jgi:hypothetical protein